ncbi:MAG: hypothetical protein IJX44_05195 [Bacteroidaceae bacterium]|nr:hypothetical protein [Bacteroidaceae bacterium]
MGRDVKGFIIITIAFAIMAIGIYIGLIYDWLYLKNLCIMLFSTVAAYIGNNYFRHDEKKRAPRSTWKWYFLLVFVLAGILTWIEYQYID